jgi:hypothetical protein
MIGCISGLHAAGGVVDEDAKLPMLLNGLLRFNGTSVTCNMTKQTARCMEVCYMGPPATNGKPANSTGKVCVVHQQHDVHKAGSAHPDNATAWAVQPGRYMA